MRLIAHWCCRWFFCWINVLNWLQTSWQMSADDAQIWATDTHRWVWHYDYVWLSAWCALTITGDHGQMSVFSPLLWAFADSHFSFLRCNTWIWTRTCTASVRVRSSSAQESWPSWRRRETWRSLLLSSPSKPRLEDSWLESMHTYHRLYILLELNCVVLFSLYFDNT